jgi:hypothetical protein
VQDDPPLNIDVFLSRDICVSSTLLNLEQNEPLPTLKHLSCIKYSFQKRTQFSQEINVLDAPLHNIDAFLLRDICVSSSNMNTHIWNNMSLTPP